MSKSPKNALTPEMRVEVFNRLLNGRSSAKLKLPNQVVVMSKGLARHLSLVVQEHDPSIGPKIFNLNSRGSYVNPMGQSVSNSFEPDSNHADADSILLQLSPLSEVEESTFDVERS